MKIASVKESMVILVAMMTLFNSCMKQDSIDERMGVAADNSEVQIEEGYFPVPDASSLPTSCIHSYQDIIAALGTNRVLIAKVILETGVVIEPGPDLQSIVYEAFSTPQANSIFNSKLSVSWRWPGGNWQLSTADVWSLGCIYQQAGQPPYTNLIKSNKIILVNTCFYWSTSIHTGERARFLILQ